MVTGDLAPLGEACVRGGGCLFLWRSVVVGRLAGKWLRYLGMLLVQFPQIVPERRCLMLGLCRRGKLVGYWDRRFGFAMTPFLGHNVGSP